MKSGFLFAIVLILIIAIPVSLTSCASTNRITPLMVASKEGNIESVKELITNGANVNAKNEVGKTALIFSSDSGHIEIVKELIAKGADVNAKDDIGTTALIYASSEGHIEVVKELIANGANVNAKTTGGGSPWGAIFRGQTALFFASQNDHTEVAKELIANGADVNAKTEVGQTALMNSAFNGNVQMVKELITNGANVNAKTKLGYTALMSASSRGHIKVVKELIANGADVNAKTTESETSLSLAKDGKHLEIIELLKEAGASDVRYKIPEPATWSFPDVIESARKISPRNIEGRLFNKLGLAYPLSELESLPVATMSAEDLQKYADIVTHAYPDAVFRLFPDSCKEIPLEQINETTVANIAYVSINAIDPSTRERAAIYLREIQERLKEDRRSNRANQIAQHFN